MIVFLSTLAILVPGGCNSHACDVRVARKQCEQGDVRSCIRRGAFQHHQDPRRMVRIARCESTLNPNAINGRYQGLFQFGAPLWGTLRYRSHSRFSAKWSSLAASLAFRKGLSSHWACR